MWFYSFCSTLFMSIFNIYHETLVMGLINISGIKEIHWEYIKKRRTHNSVQTLSLRYLEKAYVWNWKWSVQNIFSLVQFPNQISIPCITGKHYITSLTDYSQVWFSCVHFNNERRRICTVLLVLWWKNLCAALCRIATAVNPQ